jgi:hypothetical protein
VHRPRRTALGRRIACWDGRAQLDRSSGRRLGVGSDCSFGLNHRNQGFPCITVHRRRTGDARCGDAYTATPWVQTEEMDLSSYALKKALITRFALDVPLSIRALRRCVCSDCIDLENAFTAADIEISRETERVWLRHRFTYMASDAPADTQRLKHVRHTAAWGERAVRLRRAIAVSPSRAHTPILLPPMVQVPPGTARLHAGERLWGGGLPAGRSVGSKLFLLFSALKS